MSDETNRDDRGDHDDMAIALEVRRLAHDLNNALMPLMMGVTLLRRKIADPSLERTLANMETSVRRAAELAGALLALGRKQSPSETGEDKGG